LASSAHLEEFELWIALQIPSLQRASQGIVD